ncbi:MAG TPA: tautomerase family protein [Lichenihabitans sp.]|nr:tautomerase family protein [Lichenihabitans sp.]
MTLKSERSTEMKQSFYESVADGPHDRLGMRRQDVVIDLVEAAKANWSFGNGVAQYV